MTEAPTRAYGPHLIVDAYGADPDKLDDLALIYGFLDALPGRMGMRKIGPPQLVRFTEKELAGVSGIVMIVESHVSLHTYAKKDYFSFDAFSCKPFDVEMVVAALKETFGAKEMDVTVVERGKRFPAENLHD